MTGKVISTIVPFLYSLLNAFLMIIFLLRSFVSKELSFFFFFSFVALFFFFFKNISCLFSPPFPWPPNFFFCISHVDHFVSLVPKAKLPNAILVSGKHSLMPCLLILSVSVTGIFSEGEFFFFFFFSLHILQNEESHLMCVGRFSCMRIRIRKNQTNSTKFHTISPSQASSKLVLEKSASQYSFSIIVSACEITQPGLTFFFSMVNQYVEPESRVSFSFD